VVLRRVLGSLLLAACASEPPPATTRAPIVEEPVLDQPPSRTVPMHYETRRIGPPEDSSRRTQWTGTPIDLDVKDADIHDVLRLLSDVGHANLVVGDDVSGRVTMRLKQVPWDQALDVVARAKGLAVEHDGRVVLITRAHAP
jgi:type II secretory pathway component GspD/PulD (secretin)